MQGEPLCMKILVESFPTLHGPAVPPDDLHYTSAGCVEHGDASESSAFSGKSCTSKGRWQNSIHAASEFRLWIRFSIALEAFAQKYFCACDCDVMTQNISLLLPLAARRL
jgi:hypothetical protein